MSLDIDQIKQQYENSKGNRELGKWLFSIATLGLGALYLRATTMVVREGEIALRQTASGGMQLLPPGRHSNFPWESYPCEPRSLSEKLIKMGPYKIITVETGFIAKTYNKGQLEILDAGQHLISDASHTFAGFIPVKQETKKLHKVEAYTRDNVGLTLQADVRYQIIDPKQAVSVIDDIEESIKEIAITNISQIVGHHTLDEFAPATSAVYRSDHQESAHRKSDHLESDHQEHGISKLLHDIKDRVTIQLSKIGIQLLNIGITSWKINDSSLAHELAQGAVVKSQTQSRLMAAENASEVSRIETTAVARGIVAKAEAKARATELQGEAVLKVAQKMTDSTVAQEFYRGLQQTNTVKHAQHANLFFAQNPNQQPPIVASIPVAAENGTRA